MTYLNLPELRATKGIDQQQLADTVGTSRLNIARAENGVSVLAGSLRKKIAAALGVAPSDIKARS